MRVEAAVRERVRRAVRQEFDCDLPEVSLDFPPDPEFGDFAVGCFPFARKLSLTPNVVAQRLAAALSEDDVVAEVNANGAYVNVRLQPGALFGLIVDEVNTSGTTFGDAEIGAGAKAMVEYLSPNTNKPLHLGHLRNGSLGLAVARIMKAVGYDTVTANLVNDRGVHICKSMLAWQRWGGGLTPADVGVKGDHFVGNWYVRFAKELDRDPNLDQEAQAMLQRWEAGDKGTLDLWKMMNEWVYSGFAETYRRLGFEFDVFYYESNTYKLGKDLIQMGLEKGVFQKDDRGAVVAILPPTKTVLDKSGKSKEVIAFGTDKEGEPKRVTVLRADGTSVYMTQDLGTAKLKFDEHSLARSIYVVGSEQDHHFQCLFEILTQLGFDWASECHHLSYGMVYLPNGKMKSREGKVVDADDLVDGMQALAAEEIRRRDPEGKLAATEVERRAAVIGIAAIKFYLLQVSPSQTIHFDPAKSIAFDGKTGPYCMYTYARAKGVLQKAKQAGISTNPKETDFGQLGSADERLLAQALLAFPEQVAIAASEFNPSRIVNAVYNTAKAFNQFYQQHSVLNAENDSLRSARLALLQASATTIRKGLYLLGIEVLEQM